MNPEGFVYRGEKGERVGFEELSEKEQRIVLIAMGGLLRTMQKDEENPSEVLSPALVAD